MANNTSTFDSVYAIKLAQIQALNGSTGKKYDSVYEEELEMLKLLEEGGTGGGAKIDDNNVSTKTVWSSSKINTELSAKATINDEDVSTEQVWSSQYVKDAIDSHVTHIVDNDISTNTVWSSSKINTELGLKANQSTTYTKTQVDDLLTNYAFKKILTQTQYDAEQDHQENVLYLIDNEGGKGIEKAYMGDDLIHFVNEYDFNSSLNTKQDTLVSGTNIKTINNNSILGSGNITIQGGGGAGVVELTLAEYDALASKDPSTIYSITDATSYVMEDYVTNSSWNTLATTYNPYNTVTALSYGYLPSWNARGLITGYGNYMYLRSFSINGNSLTLYGTGSGSLTGIYAATSAGTSGQVLQSSGSGAPTWVDFKSDATAYIKEADCSQGTYNSSISTFYQECITAERIGPMQLVNDTTHNVKELDQVLDELTADIDFAIENGSTATITYGTSTITINSDGTISDPDSTGIITAQTAFTITGYHIFACSAAATITTGELYSIKSSTYTSHSYYYPSSTRLYQGNVELWFFTTEDGQTWTNLHIKITSSAVTADTTSGSFGS